MENFSSKKTPYEVLIRLDKEGNYQGTHVAFTETVFKDGEVYNVKVLDPTHVSKGEEDGFPFSELIETVLLEAMKKVDVLEKNKKELNNQFSELLKSFNISESELAKTKDSLEKASVRIEDIQNKFNESETKLSIESKNLITEKEITKNLASQVDSMKKEIEELKEQFKKNIEPETKNQTES